MILKEQTLNVIEGDTFGELHESTINKEKLAKLYGILSGLYRDVYGSIVRELTSNMWDSHKDANKEDEPIYIKLQQEENNDYILFKDVGLGMSPETMYGVFFNYLDSTKESNNLNIGGWGLGAKSPLAYTHTFYIDTIWNNTLSHYIFSKQANGIPAGELLYNEPTEDCNGTTIKIPIKNGDIRSFATAIKNQLIYFPNIYVESNYYWCDVKNDFKLYEGEHFIYRPDIDTSYLHLCLGNVYYQISWAELGIDRIEIPVGLKFEIGELTPTPSREDIEYSRESIQVIKDKIELLKQELANIITNKKTEFTTLKEFSLTRGQGNNITIPLVDDISLKINKKYLNINKISIKNCLIDPEVLYLYKYLDWDYGRTYVSCESGYKRTDARVFYSYSENSVEEFIRRTYNETILVSKTRLGDNLKNKSFICGYDDVYHIYKKPLKLVNYKKTILNNIPKSKWRQAIKDFQRLTDEFINDKFDNYENLKIDESWLKDYKAKKKELSEVNSNRRKELKEIVYYRPVDGTNKNYIWEKDEETIERLCSFPGAIIYVDNKDKKDSIDLFEALKLMYGNSTKVKLISTAVSYHKHFENKKNMYTYDEFIKSKHRGLIRMATAKKIKGIIKEFPRYLEHSSFKELNKDYYKTSQKLKIYIRDNLKGNYDLDELYEKILLLIEDLGLLGQDIINEANEFKLVLDKLNNIKEIFSFETSDYATLSYKYYQYAIILMKFEKLKVNKFWYFKNEFNPVFKQFNKTEE